MKITFTTGDVNGIGIEVMIKAVGRFQKNENIEFDFYGNQRIAAQRIELLNLSAEIAGNKILTGHNEIHIREFSTVYNAEPGKISREAGLHAADALEAAVKDAIAKKTDAIVTLPIAKEAMYLAGWNFPGHTEMIAARCSVKSPLMILFKDNLRAALATIHKPIRQIANLVTVETVFNSIVKLDKSLKQDFGIEKPKIAVLGLNPHAGENGNIGNEEITDILPAIHKARLKNIDCDGTFPADGFFAHKEYLKFDAYLAMYHDQGLIPLKLLADGGGVNFTAGLPIVRTSPDHGTAFGIAGKGIANEQSTLDAINAAIEICETRGRGRTVSF